MRLFSICIFGCLNAGSFAFWGYLGSKANKFFSSFGNPTTEVVCKPDSIVLTTRDCVVEIPMPDGYIYPESGLCGEIELKQLAQINACIDPKGADKLIATKSLTYMEGDDCPKELRLLGHCSHDLIGKSISAVDGGKWTFECENNLSTDKDFDTYIKVMNGRRILSLQDRMLGLRSFYSQEVPRVYAKYTVPSKKRGGIKQTTFRERMWGSKKLQSENIIDGNASLTFCNVLLHRTKQVYDIVFERRWKHLTPTQFFVDSMMFHPEWLVMGKQNWDWINGKMIRANEAVSAEEKKIPNWNIKTSIGVLKCYQDVYIASIRNPNSPDAIFSAANYEDEGGDEDYKDRCMPDEEDVGEVNADDAWI